MPNRADSSLYHLFERRGLTRSRRHFSAEWLGTAPNYLALRGRRPPSTEVLVTLFQKLWRRGAFVLAARVGLMILWPSRGSRQ
jgi:hypothetical protein